MVGTVSYSTFAGVRTRHFCHCPVFSNHIHLMILCLENCWHRCVKLMKPVKVQGSCPGHISPPEIKRKEKDYI